MKKHTSNRKKYLIILYSVFFLMGLSACSSIGYYGQSIVGHNKLMWARQPVSEVIQTAEPKLKAQLLLSQTMRQFAVDELNLPDNNSYSSYVALDRDYPVWNVVAAEEFSVQAKSWCYLIIGCASYRGYFSEQAALDYAKNLRKKGYETNVGGAIAYSTLGWFSDPLLPSMMRYGNADLAENMFHELAHQVIYVNGNSAFNEAFASVVGEQGAIRWLQEYEPQSLSNYEHRLQRNNDFSRLLNKTKSALNNLYRQDFSITKKRQAKAGLMQNLRDNYDTLKTSQWDGYSGYDRWFEAPINNARIAGISTYRDHMPELQRLLINCAGDFSLFFDVLKQTVNIHSQETLLDNLPVTCND